MSQQVINIGVIDNDGTGDPARSAFNKTNQNFTELYGRIPDPLKLLNQTGTIVQSIPSNSWVEKIIIYPQLSTPSIKIGTTTGGNDILDVTLIGSYLPVLIQTFYLSGVNLYFTITGGNVNIIIDKQTF